MTTKELCNKWYDMFVLIMETEGEKSGNIVYQEIEKRTRKQVEFNLDKQESLVFDEFISFCIAFTVLETRIDDESRMEKLMNDGEYFSSLVNDLWNRYLRKATRKFTSKYGIPQVKEDRIKNIMISVIKIVKDEKF